MTVISDKGLVGYIISTTNNTSKVQTIIDTATAVSATISTSRDSIIVRGTLDENYNLKATYIPTDAKLLQGDTVETSGIGGIYPKGIKIGKIKELSPMMLLPIPTQIESIDKAIPKYNASLASILLEPSISEDIGSRII
jgi:rod shape-determining protein MreC